MKRRDVSGSIEESIEEVKFLVRAVKSNHTINDDKSVKAVVDSESEIELYAEQDKLLVDAVKFNHNIESDTELNVIVDQDKELELYRDRDTQNTKITQLTLPARFNMVKTPTNFASTTEVEIEDPEN